MKMMTAKGKRMQDCYMNIMRKLFRVSDPPADFDKLVESGETKKRFFFMRYFIEQEVMDRIVEEEIKNSKLQGCEVDAVKHTVYLGSSPNSCRETWKKARDRFEAKKR